MRRRVLSSSLRSILSLLAILVVAPVFAQQPPAQQPPGQQPAARQSTTISILTGSSKVGDLLRQGRELEVERRWGEALTHYEDAVRLFPGQTSLRQRFELSRQHYDLQRRYADGSFMRGMAKLPTGEALELYAQVLKKIQAHYVEAPNWRGLVEHGTRNLETALSEPAFVERNLPGRRRLAADGFCHRLGRALASLPIDARTDARNAVAMAARLTQEHLEISGTAVVLEYLCGATNSLDAYSAYLTPDQLNEVYSQIEGNFIGLGIELKARAGGLSIVRVIPHSPAEQGGILAGDQILSVDGQLTEDLSTDEAADLLQGKAGSVVTLVVSTPGQPLRQVSIGRRRIDVPGIDGAQILDREHGVAYFRLVCFQKSSCRDMETALWKLHREGMKSLIIDLRGNPGGLLVTAVEVADKFIQHGVIVSTRGRSAQEDFIYSAHTAGTWRVPLVVLIDCDTASAAEIFVGAIREHRRGTVVGSRSYGKGSVQGIFPLSLSGAGLRLTTAKFYSPSGRPYSRIGVTPDVLVRVAARPIDGTVAAPSTGEDAMLAAALQAARGLGPPRQARISQ
jgi:carboxyl-terminal processing protease